MSDETQADDPQKSQIQLFESRIDKLHLDLVLLRYPKNLALWSLVTKGLEPFYQPEQEQDPQRDRTRQTVLSRSLGLFFRQVKGHQFRANAAVRNLKLDPPLAGAAAEAVSYARFWFAATGYFPEWHRRECAASITGENSIRFSLTGTTRERQVSAYQKNFRRAAMRIPRESVYAPTPDWIGPEYVRALTPGTTREDRLFYKLPAKVYEFYRDWYSEKMREGVEHPTETDLGAYDIGDAIKFWSALAAVASAHDFLCYHAARRLRLPSNSILLVRRRSVWAAELAQLSGLNLAKSDAIINSIICRPDSVIDLHVTPFIAMDDKDQWLALAGLLAISGRFDQNLLRLFSAQDPARFNRITPNKEKRLRTELASEATPLRILPSGPIALPSPLPDIDLLLEDTEQNSLAIAELKWVREPIGWKSRERATEELQRGLQQLRQIREFLDANPDYLRRNRAASKAVSEFKNVYYTVITRGHLVGVEPTANESMIPLDAVKFALKSQGNLAAAMNWLFSEAWLPEEGNDFRIRSAQFVHRGYSIEAPVWTLP